MSIPVVYLIFFNMFRKFVSTDLWLRAPLILSSGQCPGLSQGRTIDWKAQGPSKGSTVFKGFFESSVTTQKTQVMSQWVDRKPCPCLSISLPWSCCQSILALPRHLCGCLIPLLRFHPIIHPSPAGSVLCMEMQCISGLLHWLWN